MGIKKWIVPLYAAAFLTGAGIGYKGCNSTEKTQGNYFTKDNLDTAYNATFKVEATVTLEEKVDDDKDLEKSWFGSGTLLLDSQTQEWYIFTAEHVTPDATLTSKETGKTTKVIKEKITVETFNAIVFKEDEKYDLALLKLDGSPGKPFAGKIAQDFNPGNYVIGMGFLNGNKELFITQVTKISDKSIFLDIFIIGGNSGGGVYLIHEKELQLCGPVTKADRIPSLERVREFFKGTPLEDDYL